MSIFNSVRIKENCIKKIVNILLVAISIAVVNAKDVNELFINQLLASDEIDQYIVAGYLAKSLELPYTNQQLYSKAIKLAPENILLLEQILLLCDDSNSICKKREKYLKKLERHDTKNSNPNLYAIVFYGKNKQFSKALKQLKKAADKKLFEDYNWKRFFLIERVLRSYGYSNNAAKKAAAKSIFIGFDKEPIAKIMNLCVSQSETNSQWIDPCIQFGKVIETSSTMGLSTFVGYGLQRDILALDESREVEYENIKHRRDIFHQFRVKSVTNIKYAGISDETNFDDIPDIFFQDLEKFGERVALQRALDRFNNNKEKSK